jgi:hypothetical protein
MRKGLRVTRHDVVTIMQQKLNMNESLEVTAQKADIQRG